MHAGAVLAESIAARARSKSLTCWLHARECRARQELARIFSRIIRSRRASAAHEDDILQCFIDSRYEKAFPFPLQAQNRRSNAAVLAVAHSCRTAAEDRARCEGQQPVLCAAITQRQALVAGAVSHRSKSAEDRAFVVTGAVSRQCCCAAQVHGGRYLNDEEITGMLIATLFAGQHTSSITSAWTGLTMIRDKVCGTASLPAAARARAAYPHACAASGCAASRAASRPGFWGCLGFSFAP
jgi:hypothetical protein